MEHITIDYGIDLGTTNSSICRMESGKPVIVRSDTGMETMPSCISFKKGGAVRVGSSAYADLGKDKLRALRRKAAGLADTCIEFKRYMGSDTTFTSQYIDHSLTPEALSAMVVETLCSFVTDDEVKAAVVTVPAKFTVNQKDATLEAARLAGIRQVELLQEPIAASMAYGLKAEEKNGIWMVFDFGGGTLDVALVHVSDGVMQVFDTEGDNYLGGKNLDEAIVSGIILPRLCRSYSFDLADPLERALLVDALKVVAEKLKNSLSYRDSETVVLEAGDWGQDMDGEEVEMEFTVTRDEVEQVMRPLLQKAVDVCKTLMERNSIDYGRLSHLILIGGPTYIPLLRRMLAEQITPNVDTGVDPMTAVAVGASIYASTLPVRTDADACAAGGSDVLQLQVEADTATTDLFVPVPVRCVTPAADVRVRVIRRSDGWESAWTPLGPHGGVVEAELLPDQPNIFRIDACVGGSPVKCSPAEFTISQGKRAASPVLPYYIGMEVYNPRKQRSVFTSFSGLEKNRHLPAVGHVYGLRTLADLNPGVETDIVRIAVYQGDENSEGKSASLFEYVSDVTVTGADIVSYIPKDSTLDIRIDVDRSEMMTVNVLFPLSQQTVSKRLDTSRRVSAKSGQALKRDIEQARDRIGILERQLGDTADIDRYFATLARIEGDLDSGAQLKQVEQHLKEVLRQIEDFDEASEWDKEMHAVRIAHADLLSAAIGHDHEPAVQQAIADFGKRMERLPERKSIGLARALKSEMDDMAYEIRRPEIYRNFLRWAERDFDSIRWKDKEKAADLLRKVNEILIEDPLAPLHKFALLTDAINGLILRDAAQHATKLPGDIPSM